MPCRPLLNLWRLQVVTIWGPHHGSKTPSRCFRFFLFGHAAQKERDAMRQQAEILAKSVQFALDGALANGQPDVGDSRSTTAQGLTTVPPKPPDVDPEHNTDEQKAMIAANLQPDCPDPVEALGEILLCRACSPGPMQSPPMFPRPCAKRCVFVYYDWPCHQPCVLVKNHEGAHRCMQHQTAVDQALPQQETKHSSKTRRSLMPDALEEAWKTRVDRRKVDVAKGKETAEYRAYSTKVPRAAREESAPRTPDARDRTVSRRSWKAEVHQWRKLLRKWYMLQVLQADSEEVRAKQPSTVRRSVAAGASNRSHVTSGHRL